MARVHVLVCARLPQRIVHMPAWACTVQNRGCKGESACRARWGTPSLTNPSSEKKCKEGSAHRARRAAHALTEAALIKALLRQPVQQVDALVDRRLHSEGGASVNYPRYLHSKEQALREQGAGGSRRGGQQGEAGSPWSREDSGEHGAWSRENSREHGAGSREHSTSAGLQGSPGCCKQGPCSHSQG